MKGRTIRFGAVGWSSCMDTLHLIVLIPEKQQRMVVWAKFWNGFQWEAMNHSRIHQRDIRRIYSSNLVTPRWSCWGPIVKHNLCACFHPVVNRRTSMVWRDIIIPRTAMSIEVPIDEARLCWYIVELWTVILMVAGVAWTMWRKADVSNWKLAFPSQAYNNLLKLHRVGGCTGR